MFSSWNLHPQLVTDTWGNSMEVSGALLLSWGSAWTGPQQARGAQAHPLGDAEGQTFTVSNRILHRFHRFNITIIVNLCKPPIRKFNKFTGLMVWCFDPIITYPIFFSRHIPSTRSSLGPTGGSKEAMLILDQGDAAPGTHRIIQKEGLACIDICKFGRNSYRNGVLVSTIFFWGGFFDAANYRLLHVVRPWYLQMIHDLYSEGCVFLQGNRHTAVSVRSPALPPGEVRTSQDSKKI